MKIHYDSAGLRFFVVFDPGETKRPLKENKQAWRFLSSAGTWWTQDLRAVRKMRGAEMSLQTESQIKGMLQIVAATRDLELPVTNVTTERVVFKRKDTAAQVEWELMASTFMWSKLEAASAIQSVVRKYPKAVHDSTLLYEEAEKLLREQTNQMETLL